MAKRLFPSSGIFPKSFMHTPPPPPPPPNPTHTHTHTFPKTLHPHTLLASWSSKVFLINRNVTEKLSSINTIHVKQQHNSSFFIFKFTLIFTYILGNVCINKIHFRQCLYIISFYCREDFFNSFNFFVVSKEIILM